MEVKARYLNYKKLESTELDLSGCNVILVAGPNEAGKTSVITSFEEAFMAQAIAKNPVTKGKEEGKAVYEIPDKDGNMVTVVYEYNTDGTAKFSMIDSLGKIINSVTKIREILGSYARVTADQLYSLSLTESGRKTFLEKYLYEILKNPGRLAEIDKQISEAKNKSTEGNLFHTRTKLNAETRAQEIVLNTMPKPSQQDVANFPSLVNWQKSLQIIKDRIDVAKTNMPNQELVEQLQKNLEKERQAAKDEIVKLNKTISTTNFFTYSEVNDIIRRVKDNDPVNVLQDYPDKEELIGHLGEIADLEAAIEEDSFESAIELNTLQSKSFDKKAYVADVEKYDKNLPVIEALELAKKNFDAYELQRNTLVEINTKIAKITDNIEMLRAEKKQIFVESDLNGLEITEDDFLVDGISISQTCESKVKLLLADILCRVSSAKLLVLGNIDTFGKDKRKELIALAEKYNKLIFVEKVDDDTELTLTNLIID